MTRPSLTQGASGNRCQAEDFSDVEGATAAAVVGGGSGNCCRGEVFSGRRAAGLVPPLSGNVEPRHLRGEFPFVRKEPCP